MKTRLTNKYLDFVKHIEGELSKPFSADSEIIFSVFPALGSGHFSIQLIAEPNPFLLVRLWEQDLGPCYQLGIYNLDAANIKEEKVKISHKELLTIQELAKADIGVSELNGIILDGVEFELKILGEGRIIKYWWQSEEQISIKMKELIRKLASMASLERKL